MKKILIYILAFTFISGSLTAGEKYASSWEKGVNYLKSTQAANGAWGKEGEGNVGITAVVLEALSTAPAYAQKIDGIKEMKEKAASYLASRQITEKGRFNGAICDLTKYANYCTSLAVMGLAKYDSKKYAPIIAKGVEWIKQQQANKASGYDPKEHMTYGGFGYGSSTRPDLSNTWIALDALKAAGVPQDDQVWKDVQIFIKRCQNSTEVNDMNPKTVGDDGGARYLPAEHEDASPAGVEKTADGKTIYKSYGSMSYAMMLSYLWSDMKKDSLPVKLAKKWLVTNFTVDQNTNTKSNGQQGLYYYYRVMSKSLAANGEKEFGGHDWAKELGAAIVKRQRDNGSWINDQDRWGEGMAELVTGYSLCALALCE
ncbi:MAG: terpene cyclase/mutase family protein [Planctomycetes bacterium]|nr:terpene cyclase/mutase family protein [Planctomycetota bacterium]